MNKRLLLSLFILACCFPAVAQVPVWRHFGLADGLNDPNVISMAQDKDGMLWLGCQTGLVRFDGLHFDKIEPAGEDNPYITSLITDPKGCVWIGSKQGIWKYDPGQGKLRKIYDMQASSIHVELQWNDDSTEIFISGPGAMKMIPGKMPQVINPAVKGEIFKTSQVGKQFLSTGPNSLLVFSEKGQIRKLFEGKRKPDFTWYSPLKSWIVVTQDGLFSLAKDLKIQKLALNAPWERVHEQTAIFTDPQHHIWINTLDTVYRFSGLNDKHPKKYYWVRENPYSLPKSPSFFMDRDLNIWAKNPGTGISVLYRPMAEIGYKVYSEMNTRYVWATFHDPVQNRLFYGTDHGLEVFNLHESPARPKVIPDPVLPTKFLIIRIQDFDERHWVVSTYRSGTWLLDKNTFTYSPLIPEMKGYSCNGIFRMRTGETLVFTTKGIYEKPKAGKAFLWNKELLQNPISFVQSGNDLYVATDLGLYCLDFKGKVKRRILLSDPKWKKVISSAIMWIAEADGGKIFVGTISNGLCVYDPVSGTLRKIVLAQNVASVYGMSTISAAEMLLTTNLGVCLYHFNSGKSQFYNVSNLLPANDFNQFGYAFSPKLLSLCSVTGEISGAPEAIRNLFRAKAPLLIQQGHRVISSISVPAGEQSFAVNAGIGIHAIAHRPKFSYRLTGLEESWHEADPSGNINYNYIPPGSYQLEIRMSDPNNILAPQTRSIPVEVIPLWWQTFWFRAFLYVLSLVLLIFLIRYLSQLRLNWKIRRMQAEQKINNERLRISRELHDNVGSQLSYLITGLEASEMMLQKENTESLTRNLENLQDSARESMQQLRDAIWALNKEEISASVLVERFSQWAHKMTEQHNIRLEISSAIDRDLELDSLKTLNVFRILQEAVHNILKHAKASEATIRFSIQEEQLRISIQDNGKGFENIDSAGNGLKNMRTRAKELGAELGIASRAGEGTRIELRLIV